MSRTEAAAWVLSVCIGSVRGSQATTLAALGAAALVAARLTLVGLGLWAKGNLPPRRWASNHRKHECSAFTIGRLLLDQRPTTRRRLLLELFATIRRLGRNWG